MLTAPRSDLLHCYLNIQPPELEVQRRRETDPGEIWNQQKSGRFPRFPEQQDCSTDKNPHYNNIDKGQRRPVDAEKMH
jgi:hypothetical protein